MTDNLLDTHAAAALIGVSPRTVETWRVRGSGPRFVRVGRLARYRRADLDAWIAERVRESTTATAPPTGRAA